MWLDDLESLARTERARLRLTIDAGRPSVSWKQRGRRLEVVESRVVEPSHGVCAALVKRLGYGNLPTPDNLIERMTPGQKARLRSLIAEVQALKREVMAQTPILDIEPDLAGPVSSLGGQKVWR